MTDQGEIGGVGRKLHAGSFMEEATLLRKLVEQDVNGLASLEAMEEFIDMKTDRKLTIGNMLHIQIIVPATITLYNIEVWGDMSEELADPDITGGKRWSQIDELGLRTRSSFITIPDCPWGKVKVLITNVGGSFGEPIVVLYSKSQ